MLVTLVDIHVKPESVDAFVRVTLDNVRHSRQEPGIARFDLIRHRDAPGRFTLIEGFLSEQAIADHRETAHYRVWKETVDPMMIRPRHADRCEAIEP